MEFKHPKYYKEMRAERRKLQASSKPQAEESSKPQASRETGAVIVDTLRHKKDTIM